MPSGVRSTSGELVSPADGPVGSSRGSSASEKLVGLSPAERPTWTPWTTRPASDEVPKCAPADQSGVLVALSDTHGDADHRLDGRTLAAVREADLVIHAGDFTTERVLDAFVGESERFLGVRGNSDDPAVEERLPGARTLSYGDATIAVTHARGGGSTGLSLFGRERGADLVVYGHSHRPSFTDAGAVALLNPGSHAAPRGARAAHAELEAADGGLEGRLRTPSGEVFERFRVEPNRS